MAGKSLDKGPKWAVGPKRPPCEAGKSKAWVGCNGDLKTLGMPGPWAICKEVEPDQEKGVYSRQQGGMWSYRVGVCLLWFGHVLIWYFPMILWFLLFGIVINIPGLSVWLYLIVCRQEVFLHKCIQSINKNKIIIVILKQWFNPGIGCLLLLT